MPTEPLELRDKYGTVIVIERRREHVRLSIGQYDFYATPEQWARVTQGEWLPISDAPKDATYVLLWAPTWRHPFVGSASITPFMAYIDVPAATAYHQEVYASYWKPLPPPPSTALEEK